MIRNCRILPVFTAAVGSLISLGAHGQSGSQVSPEHLERIAQSVVNETVRVKEGEIVGIMGGARDLELLENLATHVRRNGAFPLVMLNSDRLLKRSFVDVPEKYDQQEPKLELALVELMDALISVDGPNPETLKGMSPHRRAARDKGEAAVGQKALKENMRSAEIGNGLYPTDWRARRFGMSTTELARSFWDGVSIDYSGVQKRGEQIRTVLASGRQLRITRPANGTDLTVNVERRPIIVSDGLISDEDMKQGGAELWVYLPAGEVMTTPVPGTAKGKLVVDRHYFDNQEIQQLTMSFDGGKLTSLMGTGPGFAAFKARYDAVKEDNKSAFAFVDFGINESVRLPATSPVGSWVPAGMVTVGVGSNIGFGGENDAAFQSSFHLPGVTVTLDGKPLVENGRLLP